MAFFAERVFSPSPRESGGSRLVSRLNITHSTSDAMASDSKGMVFVTAATAVKKHAGRAKEKVIATVHRARDAAVAD